ncbi:hypothetical protein KR084_001629, partial [Drosophila pseudotakahashii]
SNEENDDYMASLSQAQTAEDEVDGGGGREAAGSNESVLGGQTMPQISPNAPLEGNVSPPPTQPHLDDNLHNGNISNSSIINKHGSNINGNDSNRSSPAKSPKRPVSSSFRIQNAQYDHEEEDLAAGEQVAGGDRQVPDYWQQRNGGGAGGGGGAHQGGGTGGGTASGRQSRAISPGYLDNMSENSEQPPVVPLVRSKSRPEISSAAAARYNNLSYWKARRVVFYRNGDPFFPGVELRYRPGRDVTSLDNLLDKISPKMDLPRGARYVFSMDGDRKYHLDELEDGAFYVVSSFKAFKVS